MVRGTWAKIYIFYSYTAHFELGQTLINASDQLIYTLKQFHII